VVIRNNSLASFSLNNSGSFPCNYLKLYTAFREACNSAGRPILAQSVRSNSSLSGAIGKSKDY